MQRQLIHIISLLLFFCEPFFGQQPSYRNFTVNDGLASSTTYHTYQDSKGYIWISTESGVSRFDGYTFTNFSNSDGLAGNEVFKVFEDSKNRLWFLTYNGKLSFYQNGRIYNGRDFPILEEIQASTFFTYFLEHEGKLCFSTTGSGWYFLDEDLSDFEYLEQVSNTRGGIYMFLADNILYNLGRDGMVNLAERTFEKLPRISTRGSLPIAIQQSNGHILLGKENQLFLLEQIEGGRLKELPFETNGVILELHETEEGDIWVCTSNGVYFFEDGEISNNNQRHLLPGKSVSSVMMDHEKNSWISTLDDGIYFCPSLSVLTYTEEDGLSGHNVRCLNGMGNKVFVGFDKARYDVVQKNKIEQYKLIPGTEESRKRIYDIVIADQSIFFPSGYGLFELDQFGKQTQFCDFGIKEVAIRKDGEIFLGAHNIFKLEEDWEGMKEKAFNSGKETRYNNIFAMHFLDDHKLLIAGTFGLREINTQTMEVSSSSIYDPINHFTVTGISEDKNTKERFFSTYEKGIFIFNGNNVRNISEEEGMSSNICNDIVINGKEIWVATNNGINKIVNWDKEDSTSVTQYVHYDGLASNSINDLYIYQDTIWAATSQGLTFFHKEEIAKHKTHPELLLEEVLVGDEKRLGTNFNLEYSENNLCIKYTGLSYKSAGNISYQYILEGLDKDWSTTKARQIRFSALSPGNYILKIKAKSNNGLFSKKAIEISIDINPPFWKQLWFRILGIFTISLFFVWRFKTIKKRHLIQQKIITAERDKALIENEMLHLEQKALRLQMNPHFIFNALNAIQGFYANNETETAKKYLTRFSRLIRLILESSKKTSIPLANELSIIRYYLVLKQLSFKNKFDFSIDVAPAINVEELNIPPMLVQPFIENAVLHGIAPKEGPGLISVRFFLNEGKLTCEVEDNGIGRTRAQQIEKIHKGPSLGINITQERLIKINATEKLENCFKITDLYFPNGTAKGTLVAFTLPIYSSDPTTSSNFLPFIQKTKKTTHV